MKINLLPPPPPKVRRYFVIYWVIVGILVAWLLQGAINFYLDSESIVSKQAMVNSTSSTLQQLQAKLNLLQTKSDKLNQSQQLLQLRSELPKPMEAIQNLYTLLPKDGSYTAINYSSGTISTSVNLSSYYEAAAFIVGLYNDAAFTNVNVTSITSSSGPSTASQVSVSSGSQSVEPRLAQVVTKIEQGSGLKSRTLTPAEKSTLEALSTLARQNNSTLIGAAGGNSVTVPFTVTIAPGFSGGSGK